MKFCQEALKDEDGHCSQGVKYEDNPKIEECDECRKAREKKEEDDPEILLNKPKQVRFSNWVEEIPSDDSGCDA